MGQQPLKTIVTYLAAADILLLSTRNQISEAARWPIRLGDYLASGRPVVAGDIGEIGSVIRDARCGLLARPGDEKDFAHKSIQLGLNPKTWEELGSNARRAAEQKFAWSLIADDLDHIYNTFQRRS